MKSKDVISIKGARVHNLKNVSLNIPRNKFVVFTGISGSGKSSLAFDTIYAEGQRRYIESLSAYARQFLGVMDKPDVDRIEGISPAISIDQKSVARNPRSTVGTITEIYDYFRLLFSRIGVAHCPKCNLPITKQTPTEIVDKILALEPGSAIMILGPVIKGKKGEHRAILEEIQNAGFIRVRINGTLQRIEEALETPLNRYKIHNIDAVVDRIQLEDNKEDNDRIRIMDSVETALKAGKGTIVVNLRMGKAGKKQIKNAGDVSEDLTFSEHFACKKCGFSMSAIEPRSFSFNSPYGACKECTGLGSKLEVDPKLVIPNTSLSIAEGAIKPWMHASHRVGRQGHYWWQLSELAEKHKFSMHDPVKKLSRKELDLILYGEEGKEATDYKLQAKSSFEGVIPNLERRYHETDSDWTRHEIEKYMIKRDCPSCLGKRLRPEFLSVRVAEKSIDQVVEMSIEECLVFSKILLTSKSQTLSDGDLKISRPIAKEVQNRLQFLIDVGLGYLALGRSSATLAGGEAQRIRLATQIGSKLVGVLYILDEPSIGLHQRDQRRLIKTLCDLRDLGNTVLVVEHDEQTIRASDWVIDIGPGAGKHGGEIMFEGSSADLAKKKTLTGDYLSGRKKVKVANKNHNGKFKKFLTIVGAAEHNLKEIDVKIPLGMFVAITGVSGSGKSSLVNDILAKALMKKFYRAKDQPGKHKGLKGIEHINKVVVVDQSAIGRTPRSNPATYTGVFTFMRDLFSKTKEARVRGYGPGRFSFNVKGGRCEVCRGDGVKKVEMYFLPDVYVECEECHGKRYNKEALEIEYRGRNISQVLDMTIEEALEFFKHIPAVKQKLHTLTEVGLGYVQLGQPAPSLSGGEAQRVKLATELSRRDTGKTLYILDEPTTGLHFFDIENLMKVLVGLVDKGNSVVVIEHNLEIIRNANWIIDLGPEGGDAGGEIVAEGTPKDITRAKKSYTGQYLKKT